MQDKFIFPTWLMIIIVVVIVAIILAILFSFFKDILTVIFSKTVTTQATLTSKYDQDYVTQQVYAGGDPASGNVSTGLAEKGKEYFFSFQLENGKQLTFLVSKDAYDVAVEESAGTLIYKGKRFISYDGCTSGTRIRTDEPANNFVGVNKDHL